MPAVMMEKPLPKAQLTIDQLRYEYTVDDVDTRILLDNFDDVPGRTVLEVGSHDESSDAAAIIARSGQRVIGIDLRQPNHGGAGKEYEYLQADFCDLPAGFIRTHAGRVDAIFSISAIEHFGLAAYQEKPAFCYDVIAMRQMWQLLKPGGKAYVTVPYGKEFLVKFPYWYVYNQAAIIDRIVGDFQIETACWFTSAVAVINGVPRPRNCYVSLEEADGYDGRLDPHVTIFLKLVKNQVDRCLPAV